MRTEKDAPCHYSSSEAGAWACGYEAGFDEPRKVYVVIYDHRHGRDIAAFNTMIAAQEYKNDIARNWWRQEIGDRLPMPETDPGDAYFDWVADHRGDEFFEIEELEVRS